MLIETKTLGKVEIEEKNVLNFPEGLFGFEEFHKYALINAEYEPFYYLQSLDTKDLAFLLVDPFLIAPEYELDIDDSILEEIGIKTVSDVLLYAIVTIPVNGSPVTANLQGPVIINRKNNKALQAVLTNTQWTTKHDIVKALQKTVAAGEGK